jgi:hypothetical protein
MHWHAFFSDLFGPGTWGAGGNLAAAPILAAVSLLAAYLGRHKIGRTLAAWWALHHGPHAIAQHREALRQHEASRRRDSSQEEPHAD